MSCINSHPLSVASPKSADPLGEEPCAHAVQRCPAAPDFAGCSAGEHNTSGSTRGQTQQCLMLCCFLVSTELVFFFFFLHCSPGMGLNTAGKLPAWGKLSRAAYATAQVPAKQLAPSTSATGLTSQQLHCFTPMEDLGQGDYGNVQVCWCRACQPDLLLLPQPAEQQHRSTGAGETCTVRSFFIILPCQSGTSKRQYFLFPFKENTMTVLQTGRLF